MSATVVDLEAARAERMRPSSFGYVDDGEVVVTFTTGEVARMSPGAAEAWARGLLALAASARAGGK